MAIKGKKKSQARGSQARRRPATAPRPYGGGRPTTPWYATTRGKTVLAIAGAAVVVAVMWGVANAQSHERDLQRRQRSLNAYTDQVRAVLAMISPVTSAMDRAPTQASSKVGATLKKQSSDWVKGLQQVAPQVSRLAAPAPLAGATQVFGSSAQLYLSAASSYRLAATLTGRQQEEALVQAGAQRDQARSLWLTAVEMLDRSRAAAKLPASGLQLAQTTLPAPPSPSPAPRPTSGSRQSSGNSGGSNNGGG